MPVALPPNVSNIATLSAAERRAMSLLIIEPDSNVRNTFRQTLTSLGYVNFSDAADHALGLEKLEGKPLTHIIFDAKKTTMTPKEFVSKAIAMDPRVVLIPSSFNPTVDDVFQLLMIGARGYVVKPFTGESLDDSIVQATKGEPVAEVILHAKNRNEALAALLLSSLDKLANVLRQAEKFETAAREVPRRAVAFRRSAEIARLFSDGGLDRFLDALVEYGAERGTGPATRLGRVREKLRDRKVVVGEGEDGAETTLEEEESPEGSRITA